MIWWCEQNNFLYLLKLSRNVNHISFCTPVSGKNYRNLDNKRDSHYRAVIAQCEPGLKDKNLICDR